jgi:hypothetical protein
MAGLLISSTVYVRILRYTGYYTYIRGRRRCRLRVVPIPTHLASHIIAGPGSGQAAGSGRGTQAAGREPAGQALEHRAQLEQTQSPSGTPGRAGTRQRVWYPRLQQLHSSILPHQPLRLLHAWHATSAGSQAAPTGAAATSCRHRRLPPTAADYRANCRRRICQSMMYGLLRPGTLGRMGTVPSGPGPAENGTWP